MADFHIFDERTEPPAKRQKIVPPNIAAAINSEPPQYEPPKAVEKYEWVLESHLASLEHPADILEYFLPDRILDLIIHETNRRANSDIATSSRRKSTGTRRWHHVTVREFKRFLGVYFWLSLRPAIVLEDAWISPSFLSQHIGRSRWQQIYRFLSLNADIVLASQDAWFWKIRPIVDEIREVWRRSSTPSSDAAVDEEMLKFLGRSLHTVTIKTKSDPIGFKIWCLGSGGGFIHDFLMHSLRDGPEKIRKAGLNIEIDAQRVPLMTRNNEQQGKATNVHLAATQAVVYKLCQRLRDLFSGRIVIYLDNLFTTTALCHALRELDIGVMGIVRQNNADGVPQDLKTIHKQYEKEVPFNQIVAREKDGILIYLWHDSRLIMCMTTAFTTATVQKVRKRPTGKVNKQGHQEFGDEIFKRLEIPQANDEYNHNMNQVDVASQLSNTLSSHREQQHKWWRVFFEWLLDTFVNNGYLV